MCYCVYGNDSVLCVIVFMVTFPRESTELAHSALKEMYQRHWQPRRPYLRSAKSIPLHPSSVSSSQHIKERRTANFGESPEI